MRELYPPILPSYMSAFDYSSSDGVRVYFQLSSYNTLSQVSQVQAVVRYQTDNSSALKVSSYPSEILTTSISYDDTTTSDYKYYIVITPGMIQNGFEVDKIYKVQLRLTSATAATDYSEWSTVCLLKPIQIPTLSCQQFQAADNVLDVSELNLTLAATDAIFNCTYTISKKSNETLKSYRMKLYQDIEGNRILLGDSNEVIFNAYDYKAITDGGNISFPFEYNFHNQLYEDNIYYLEITAESKNGYQINRSYLFSVIQIFSSDFNPTLTVTTNEEEAYTKIEIAENVIRNQRFTLLRSSSRSNFQTWEDIENYRIYQMTTNEVYYDFTIESGVIYQYAVQARDNLNRRGPLVKSNKAMAEFEHCYLLSTNGDLDTVRQLKLSYNVTIDNFNTTVMENKVDTIGSKYPYITRNGVPYYKSFSISGLISYHMDDQEFFLSRREAYGSSNEDFYNSYNTVRANNQNEVMGKGSKYSHTYNQMYDYTYERFFREAVMEFLYDNKPKLFKSLTEGNVLVKLSDISFSPTQELGRMLYSFSATAYEIDKHDIETLAYYNIININYYEPIISYDITRLGQFNSIDTRFTNNWSLRNALNKKYGLGEIINDSIVKDIELTYLKIQFESKPYLIDGDAMVPINNAANIANPLSGWIINNNGNKILVSWPNNVYEFKGDNITFSPSISFPKAADMTIDYVVNLTTEPANQIYVSQLEYDKCLGQMIKTFKPTYNFVNGILNKYYYETNTNKVEVNGIYSLDIEAEPGTVVGIQTTNENTEKRYVINFTGKLFIQTDNTQVNFVKGYFRGINVPTSKINLLPFKPDAAMPYDAYIENGVVYVWVKNSWAAAAPQSDNTYDIVVPVDGIVNYYIQIARSTYST